MGATDACVFEKQGALYLFVTNSVDNAGNSNLNSAVYIWNDSSRRFASTPVQYVATRGASACQIIDFDNKIYLVVANMFDSTNDNYHIK